MAEFSKIAWTDATLNFWIGCSRVSPGCQNCYAENLMANRYGRVEWGPGKERSKTKTAKDARKWQKEAAANGVRKRVFVSSLSDWLDEEIPKEWRDEIFSTVEACPNLDWLMLTKRPQNAFDMLPDSWLIKPLPNVWFGVTCENQEWYEKRMAILEKIPAAIKWVSYEPSLGPLKIGTSALGFDWLIIGGESSQAAPARQFQIEWAEDAIRDCRRSETIPFMKQLGSNAFYRGEPYKTKSKDGSDPEEWPESIRVREFPKTAIDKLVPAT